jgi:metal transporter CNNM
VSALLEVIEVIAIIILSALFSGLDVGIMSLNLGDLQRRAKLGNPQALKVLPLRKNKHLTIAAVMLGDVATISAISLILDQHLRGIVAGAISTLVVVIFSEIIPQAFFVRAPLSLCYKFSPLMKLVIFITYPVSKPLQYLLDKFFGAETTKLRSRHELGLMMADHAGNKQSELNDDEVKIIRGALMMNEKRARDIMTPIEDVYWLDEEAVIDGTKIDEIKLKGHSRIPVLKHDLTRSYGILRMKDLFDVDFNEEAITAKDLIVYTTPTIGSMMELDTLFKRSLAKRTHLFPVEHEGKIIGIVTTDDLIGEILQRKIRDEVANLAISQA